VASLLKTFKFSILDELIKIHRETGKPVSSWQIAQTLINRKGDKPTKRELYKLHNKISYYLKKLAEKEILIEHREKHGSRTWSSYTPNPDRVVCHNGVVFVLDSPLTILNCPYIDICPCRDDPSIEDCPLIQNAPPELRNWISKHLNP